ncbi:hypothetical protein HYS94_01540 [Candidatus Daviesbacteria bacterium]|nr:hypothetical protein [Candidatus Daviesbacteria bacterium]
MAVFLNTQTELALGFEPTFGTRAAAATIRSTPGIWETVDLPDPDMGFEPHYFVADSTNANRNFRFIYRGKRSHNLSIPNMLAIDGTALRWSIGSVATPTATTSTATTFTLPVARGATVITVADTAGFIAGDNIRIAGTSAIAEVRTITLVTGGVGGTLTFANQPLQFTHAAATDANVHEVVAPFTHQIRETNVLDSMTLWSRYTDSDSTAANNFVRLHSGVKIGRTTYSADDGGALRVSWDGIAQDMVHNQQFHSSIGGGATDISNYHADAIAAFPGVTYPTTEPYYFSQGLLTAFGVAFARVRNFRIDVDNNLEPRYYIRDNIPSQVPREIQENPRTYRMSATIALPDSFAATATTRSLWKELVVEGTYATFAGFDMTLVFTRGTNDTITFTIPPSAAAAGNNAQGAFITRAHHPLGGDSPIHIPVEIVFRSMSINVVDSLAYYP